MAWGAVNQVAIVTAAGASARIRPRRRATQNMTRVTIDQTRPVDIMRGKANSGDASTDHRAISSTRSRLSPIKRRKVSSRPKGAAIAAAAAVGVVQSVMIGVDMMLAITLNSAARSK